MVPYYGYTGAGPWAARTPSDLELSDVQYRARPPSGGKITRRVVKESPGWSLRVLTTWLGQVWFGLQECQTSVRKLPGLIL